MSQPQAALATPRERTGPANRASEIDRHVGSRIRERRIVMGLSQQQMADMIGVTYQQVRGDKQDETAASIRMRRRRSAARNGGRA